MAFGKLFTYGPANVDTLLSTTQSVLAKLGPAYFQDAIFNKIPLLNWLRKKAQVTYQGGATILVPLLYGKNTTFAAFSGLDLIDTTVQDGLTMAQAPFINYGGTISLVGDELASNAGQGKLTDYVKAKTMQALMSGRDILNADMFASTQASKKVSALPAFVDATSTVHDINSTTSSWWQAQVTASGSFSGQGIADLRTLRDNIMQRGQQGNSASDYIVTTALVKQFLENSQEGSIRYGSRDSADPTFESLKFNMAVVEFDPNCATGQLYMLSSDVLEFVVHPEYDFNVGNFVEPTNQWAKTAKVIFRGNLITKNRRKLGKLTGITA